MLFLSIGLWCVAVYGLRIAVFGNPLYLHVLRADPARLAELDEILESRRRALTEVEHRFVRRFVFLAGLGLGAFLLEFGLLVFLWVYGPAKLLSFLLLLKNVAALGASAHLARAHGADGLFRTALHLPRWAVWADRISSLASGVGCLALFVIVNVTGG